MSFAFALISLYIASAQDVTSRLPGRSKIETKTLLSPSECEVCGIASPGRAGAPSFAAGTCHLVASTHRPGTRAARTIRWPYFSLTRRAAARYHALGALVLVPGGGGSSSSRRSFRTRTRERRGSSDSDGHVAAVDVGKVKRLPLLASG